MKAKRDRGDQGKSPAHLRWARRVTKKWQADMLNGKTPKSIEHIRGLWYRNQVHPMMATLTSYWFDNCDFGVVLILILIFGRRGKPAKPTEHMKEGMRDPITALVHVLYVMCM